MKALVWIYRTLLLVLIAVLIIFGIKGILNCTDLSNVKNDLLYWSSIVVIIMGLFFIMRDYLRTDKEKKQLKKMSKLSRNDENDENERIKILSELKRVFPGGHITDNRLFLLYFSDNERFIYCDTLKNIIGISACEYKRYFGSIKKSERVFYLTEKIESIVNDKLYVVTFFNESKELIKCVACKQNELEKLIEKEKNPFDSFNIFEKIISCILLAFPQKMAFAQVQNFSGSDL